jgi:hypothetical protein
VGDFGQLAGNLVLQARTQGTVYRDIIFAGGLSNGDALMTILGEGNVGIGTTGPLAKLDVNGDIRLPLGSKLYINNSGENITSTINGDLELNSRTELRIKANTGANAGNSLELYTSNSERMRITSDGNVGIGTTSPGTALQVGGLDDGSNYDITLGWNAVDSEAVGTKRSAITFKTTQAAVNNEDIYKWDIAMLAAPATVTGEEFGSDLAFLRSTRGSTATDATTMILTRTGNVGIGTASPSRLLQLNSSGQTDLHLTSTNQGVGASDGMTIFLDASGTGGLWLREAAALRFATSSSERMRIDASGNVGIGVTSIPGWANLITSGTVAVGGMLYIKSNNFIQGLSGFPGSSDKLIINPDGGNVGIGTTAPASKLHVNGGIGTYTSDWVTTVSGSRLLMKTFAGTGDTYSLIQAQDVGGNSNNALVLQPYGDNVGIGTTNPLSILHVVSREIGNGANKGIRIENYNGTKDYSIRTGVSGIENTSLAFYDETAGANRIVITSGGNVGIGTVSPGQRLEVDGNTLINNSGDGKLYLGSTSDYIGNIGSDIYMYSSGQNIFYAGNVGIGTTSPNHKLDIYSNENVPLRIHRPSNANLDSSGAWGIGFSTRGDANTSTTDTRAGIFSYYNGNLFLAAANTSIVADPDAYARLTILNAGSIKFNSYNSTNNTGTPTYLLGTDASGNIVKTNTVPGSAAGPYLPLAGGTMTGTIIFQTVEVQTLEMVMTFRYTTMEVIVI